MIAPFRPEGAKPGVSWAAEVPRRVFLRRRQRMAEWPHTSLWACLGPFHFLEERYTRWWLRSLRAQKFCHSVTWVIPIVIMIKNISSNLLRTSSILVIVLSIWQPLFCDHHTNLVIKKLLLISPFYVWEDWGLRKLMNRSSFLGTMFFTAALYCKFHSSLCSTYQMRFELMRFYWTRKQSSLNVFPSILLIGLIILGSEAFILLDLEGRGME